ncbi:MAG: hypothetical protein R3C68_14915 [Myxococcota bacterium]
MAWRPSAANALSSLVEEELVATEKAAKERAAPPPPPAGLPDMGMSDLESMISLALREALRQRGRCRHLHHCLWVMHWDHQRGLVYRRRDRLAAALVR